MINWLINIKLSIYIKWLTILHGLYCTIIAFIYTKEENIVDFGYMLVDINYFLTYIAFISAFILTGITMKIENNEIRNNLGTIWIIYGIFQMIWLFFLDSEYSLITNTITGLLFISSVFYIYEIRSRRD